MEPAKWEKVGSDEVLNHPRMRLVEDEVILPNGQHARYLRQAPVSTHSVAVIALNDAGEMLLQREYSYPPNEILWQLPGGSISKGEDVVEAARRELSEESGLTARECKVLGHYFTNNRRSDEQQHVVLCRGLVRRQAEADPEEFIESQWVSVKGLDDMIASGEFKNVYLLAALNLWRVIRS